MTEQKKENSGLASALNEAQSIIEAAEKRAQELKKEAEKIYQESQEKGYRDGLKQGLRDASAQAVRLIEESTEVADKLAEEAAKLAVAISATVINEQITLSPEVVKNIAVSAIQESVIGDSVNLIVSIADKETISNSLDLLRRVAGRASVSIETDPSLTRGSCIVRTDFGEVDASIEALLDSVRERLGLKNYDE